MFQTLGLFDGIRAIVAKISNENQLTPEQKMRYSRAMEVAHRIGLEGAKARWFALRLFLFAEAEDKLKAVVKS